MKNHVRKLVAFLMALLMAFEMAPVAVLAEALTAAPAAQEQAQEEISEELPEEPLAVDNSDAQQLFDRQLTKPTEEPEPEILHSVELGQDQVVVQPVAPEALDSLIQQIEGLTIQPGSIKKMGIKKQAAAGPMKADAPTAGDDSASHTGYAAFDIAPAEGQPQAQEYTVTVDLANPVDLLADYALEKDRSYTIDAVSYTLYHFHTDEEGNTRMETLALADENVDRQENRLNGFTFTTGDFSTFVIKYTVDFHYNGVDYSIPGESQILLSDLIKQLNIMNGDALLDVADVASVSFTDEHLVTVEQVSGLITYNNEENVNVGDKDFLLTSLAPFTSDEKLTITLTNGETIDVGVTDAQEGDIVYEITDNANTTLSTILQATKQEDQLKTVGTYSDGLYWCGVTIYNEADKQIFDTGNYYGSGNDITLKNLSMIGYEKEGRLVLSQYTDTWHDSVLSNGGNVIILRQTVKSLPILTDGVFDYMVDENDSTHKSVQIIGLNENYSGGDIVISGSAVLPDVDSENLTDTKTYTITKVSNGAFTQETRIKSVTFENASALTLEGDAFYGANGISTVTFNNSGAITIGSYALSAIQGLSSVTFNNSGDVTLGGYALASNTSLETVAFNNSGKVIFGGNYQFRNCAKLKSITSNGTGEVDIGYSSYTFYLCPALESVSFNNLSYLGYCSFYGNGSLKDFYAGSASRTTLNQFSFYNVNASNGFTAQFDGGVSNSGKTTVFSSCGPVDLIIGKGFIYSGDFNGCNQIQSLTLGSGVTIASSSFKNCTGLKSITVESENLSVSSAAFSGCTALESVTFKTAKVMGFWYWKEDAFDNTASLKIITQGTKEISSGFNSVQFINSIEVNGSDIKIGDNVFGACSAQSITINGDSVSLGSAAFANCAQLTKVDINAAVAKVASYSLQSLSTSGASEPLVINFKEPVGQFDGKSVLPPNGPVVINVTGDSTKDVEDAIADDSKLTVNFDMYKFQVEGASEYLDKLTQTTVTYKRYHDNTFWYDLDKDDDGQMIATVTGLYNESATEVVIGPMTDDDNKFAVVGVAANALKGNGTITKVTISANKDITVRGSAFQSMSALNAVEINGSGLVTIGEDNWERVFGYCGNLETVSGTGKVSFIGHGTFEGCGKLTTVSVSHIVRIAQNTFIDNKQAPLTVVADSIDKIEYEGFNRCALELLHCKTGNPEMERNWGGSIRYNASDLTIQFDSGVSKGYGGSFNAVEGKSITFKAVNTEPISICKWGLDNTDLTAVVIEAPSVEIGDSAFSGCSKLQSVDITGSVTNMESWAFNNCTALKTVKVTGNVGEIWGRTFNNCTGLESVEISGNLNILHSNAIDGSKENPITIKAFKVGGDVGTFDSWGFNWCNLETVEIGGNVDTVKAYAFNECHYLDKLIILGSTNKINSQGIRSSSLRVAILKGGVGEAEDGAFTSGDGTGKPFNASNNLVYIGNKSGIKVGSSAFGDDAAKIYFNMAKADVTGTPRQEKVYYADGTISADIYVNPDHADGESDGSEAKPFAAIVDAMNYAETHSAVKAKFNQDVSAAGVGDLNLPFNSGMSDGDGITLHITTTSSDSVEIPAGVLEDNDTVEGIVFENSAATQINIAAGALKNCAALASVEVKNSDAKVFVGKDAFEGCTNLNSSCEAEQTVESDAGKVTLAKGVNAMIGTRLVKADADEDAAIKAQIETDYAEFDTPIVEYFDLHLENIHGNKVEGTAADVTMAADIPATAWHIYIYHNTGSAVESFRITGENSTITADKLTEVRFHVDSLSPFATAYCPGTPYHDDMFWYEVTRNEEDKVTGAVITGIYDGTADDGTEAYTGNTLEFTGKTRDEKEYPVTAIESEAFKDNSTITTAVFTNEDELGVGEDAFSGCTALATVVEAGSGTHEAAFDAATTIAYIQAPETLDENALANSALTTIYFGSAIGEGVAAAIANASSAAKVYINAKQMECAGAEALDAALQEKGDQAPQVFYLEGEAARGDLYIGNSPQTTEERDDKGKLIAPTGTKEQPFNTFAQLSEYTGGKGGSNAEKEEVIEDASAMAEDLNQILTDNQIEHTVPGEYKQFLTGPYSVYVLNTVTVSGTEEWDSDASDPIVLNRASSNSGTMVNVIGTLTLKNVVLDGGYGNGIKASNTMIDVAKGASLNIENGAVLRNNYRSTMSINGTSTEAEYKGGGAVMAHGNVNMSGGEISGNSATYGGGIHVSGATFTMSGGTITGNHAIYGDAQANGGGVLLSLDAQMEMSGNALISNNESYGIGGGIKVGAGYVLKGSRTHVATLTMKGGTISDNTSYNEGGGINIESGSTATVYAGYITGNHSKNGYFGGGGVYVNAHRTGASTSDDGLLQLYNVVITANTAHNVMRNSADQLRGGHGIAGCESSSETIHIGQGAVIYNNGDEDVTTTYSSTPVNFWPPVAISPVMLGGGLYNWKNNNDGSDLPGGIYGEWYIHLSSHPSQADIEKGRALATVFITDNVAETLGGGIGSNGRVIIGETPPDSAVSITPKAFKTVRGADMKEGQTFTFSIYKENPREGAFGFVSYAPDELLGKAVGTVKNVKEDGTAEIDFGDFSYTIEHARNYVGKDVTLLVIEDQRSSDELKADDSTYLAYTYSIGEGVDGEGKPCYKAYLTKTEKGEYELDDEGKPNFSLKTIFLIGRDRSAVKPEDMKFTNDLLVKDVSIDKTWLNYDGSDTPPEGAKVTFELLADGKPFDPAKTIDLDGTVDEIGESKAWTATWKDLPAYKTEEGQLVKDDQGNYVKIAYTVKETKVELPEGSYATYLSDAQTTPVNATSTKPAKIENKQQTGELAVSKKVISDRAADKDQTFEFTVELSDKTITHEFNTTEEGRTVKFTQGVSDKIELKGGESLTIIGLPTGVKYTVTEAEAEGFKLTGKTGDEGKISTTKSEAKFENNRVPGELEISKMLISDKAADAEQVFTFTVKVKGLTDGEHTYSGVKFTNGEATVELKGGQSKLIEGLPTGVTYTVTEADAEGFKLTGKTGDEGKISTTKSEAEFTNSRDTGDLEVTKTIHSEAAVDKDAEFQFTVTLIGLNAEAANKTYGEMTFKDSVATFTLKDGESKKATGLPIGITYTVEETPVKGYTADKATQTGTIEAETSTVAVVNTYSAKGETPLTAEKQITGRDFQAGDEWTFTVTVDKAEAPLPNPASVTIEPTEGKTAQIDFGKIKFTEADDGKTYTYTITETGTVAGVTNDGAKTVTVKVKDNKDGTLTITNSAEETKPVFVNPYHAAGKITLEATKTIENRDFQAGDKWTFTVTADKSEAPLPNPASVTIEPTEGKTAAIDFGDIEYTEADVDKTYVYTITETGDVKGVSNDSVKTATVKITDNGDGTLKVEKTYNNGTADLTFTNTYNADSETTLKGAKKIAGREFQAGDKWTFKVTAQPADAPMPEKTEITVEPTEGSSVDLDFGKIAYHLADLKGETSASFTYTITETGDVKGVTNDSAKTVTIQVTDNKDGTLKVENSANETSLVFTNTYDAKGEVTLSARKVLEGRELKEGEFSFQLKDKNGTVLQTKANALDGSVTFDKIAYTLADVKNSPFIYTINEVEPADKSVIFDHTVKTVTVTLTDKGDGTVQAVADKTAEELTFTNQVTLVKVKKTDLDTGKALAGATIQILDKDGNVLDEWVTTLENHESRGLKIGEEYTIRETVAPAGYAVTTEFTFTIDETGKVHSIAEQTEDGALKVEDPPETTEATVKKVWVDADDADGIRPEKLTVKLSNGEQYELNAENEWTVTVKDLPKYEEAEDGTLQEIAYTWQEVDLPEGYTLTNTETQGTVTTLTNSHDAGKISLSVMKIWQDDGNRDGIRPVSLTVDLYADGVPSGKSVILRAENNWFATLSDLDKIKDGAEITYQWVENLPSTYKYTLTNEATVGSITMLTNTYQPEKTAVKVRKDWDDHENAAKLRPESIQVQLYANGVACGAAVALSAANGWHYEWTNLNKYDNPKGLTGTQQAISYTVEEIGTPAHYSSALAGSQTAGYTITNKLAAGNLIIEKTFEIVPVATVVTPTPTPTATPEPTPEPEVTPESTPEAERIDIPVTKVWKDNDDRDGNRPAVVTVHLLADGTEVASAVLSSTNSWSHTFVSLPTRNGEDVIQYTVTEDPVEWYQTQVSGFTITNVYRPEVTSVTVQKVWDDDNNALGMRPAAIMVVLSNGQAVTLNEYNGWRATVNNLPTRVNGQPVTYTWHEQEVLGYVQTGYYVTGDTTVFTNSIHRRLVEPPEDAPKKKRGETYYVLDDYETPLGVEVTINHVGDCFD